MAVRDKNTWTDGAEAMMKSWSEAQKLMWEGWNDVAKATTMGGSSANPFAGSVREWQRMTEENLKAWQGGDAFSNSLVERFTSGQSAFMHLVEHAAEAWQTMLPQLSAQGEWQKSLQEYAQKVQKDFLNLPANTLQSTTDMTELWELYSQEMQRFAKLWGMPMAKPDAKESEVTRLMDRFWGAYDKTLGRVVQSPTMGYSREFNAKLLNGFDSWVEVRRADAEYQALVAEIWLKAFDALMRTLVEKTQQGKPPQDAKAFINLWVNVADEVFVEEFSQEAYIKVQGKLLNATMAHRLRERAIMEQFMSAYGLPTRTELDETHKTIYELRRELRALKGVRKELNELKSAADGDLERELEILKDELEELRADLRKAREATRASALERNLPLKDYQELTISDIEGKFKDLSGYELEQIRAFELLHKNRKTLLQALDRELKGEE